LRLVAQMDEEAGEMSVVLVCSRCPQREIMPVRYLLTGSPKTDDARCIEPVRIDRDFF
jgi:hypothetical protein